MRKVYREYGSDGSVVSVNVPNNSMMCYYGSTHEEAIRGLHNLLKQKVGLIDNLIMLLEQGYDDCEELCTKVLDDFWYEYDGEHPESILKCIKEFRLTLKVIARDIETGSVEYVTVEDQELI